VQTIERAVAEKLRTSGTKTELNVRTIKVNFRDLLMNTRSYAKLLGGA